MENKISYKYSNYIKVIKVDDFRVLNKNINVDNYSAVFISYNTETNKLELLGVRREGSFKSDLELYRLSFEDDESLECSWFYVGSLD
ncbi:MAG: hypothetical protein K0R54_753 [Clostridiaceae bacterium]|jgi:hypothetical protein|nr:hypothetical protein [Clostridiaceae bacterium]